MNLLDDHTRHTAELADRPVTAQIGRLASLIDTFEHGPYGLSAISGTVWCLWWKRWTQEERDHYLALDDRELPDLTAEVIDHLEHARIA